MTLYGTKPVGQAVNTFRVFKDTLTVVQLAVLLSQFTYTTYSSSAVWNEHFPSSSSK